MDGDVVAGRVVDPGSGVPVCVSDVVGAGVVGSPVGVVDGFRAWLGGVGSAGLSDRERVDLVASLERVKGAASAAQARVTDAVACSREVAEPRDVSRSVGSVVALARRESPTLGDRFVGLARALVHEMPQTMAALSAGACGERVAVAVVQATATLSLEDRAEVDRRVGPLLGRLGVKQAGAAAARVAAELDAASVVARMEAAVRSRRVTVRPAPDAMAYLSVLGPLKDVVGAYAALQARSRAVVSGQCPDEAPEGRGVGAVAADTALALLSGRATGQVQPVEVHLVMTDRALLGSGDDDRSVFEPARVPGHGSVPAPVARAWLRHGLDGPPAPGGAAAALAAAGLPAVGIPAATGAGTSPGHPSGTVATGDDSQPARVWVRRLYTSPDGRDLVAMDSRRRLFGGLLRRMLVLRDDVCTTAWCEAPIVHADHTTPARDGGRTTFQEGSGKCARCNQGKEAPGWRHQVTYLQLRDDQDTRGRDHGGRLARVVQVTTPLGHQYTSQPPPLLGWGSVTLPLPIGQPAEGEPGAAAQPVSTSTTTSRPRAPKQTQPRTGSARPKRSSSRTERSPESVPKRPVELTLSPQPRPLTSPGPHRSTAAGREAGPPHWRKRPLRRPRTVNDAPVTRSRRRPRTTSHLERELCRYLT